MNIKEIIQKSKEETEKFKNSKDIETLKSIDKKVLIPIAVLLLVIFGFYYYYIFAIYPNKNTNKNTPPVSDQTTYYTSMKSSMNNSQDETINIYKIPANFMDVQKIPSSEKDLYINAFDIIFDYINQINKKNYSLAMKFMNPDFISINNLTSDSLQNYFNNIYFEKNTFFIDNILKIDNNTYSVKLTIGNEDIDGVGFYTNYKLINNNEKFEIIIDDLIKYLKYEAPLESQNNLS